MQRLGLLLCSVYYHGMLGEPVLFDGKDVIGAKESELVGAMGEVLLTAVLFDQVFEDSCLVPHYTDR
jgi:hypothetical protein